MNNFDMVLLGAIVCVIGIAGGIAAAEVKYYDDFEELRIFREVDAAMEKAGAHRWCEFVLSGQIVIQED